MAIFCVLTAVYSPQIAEALRGATDRCLNIIIPSLFMFMAISSMLLNSRSYMMIAKPFTLLTRYIFRIPNELFSIFILSNIGGYPIGVSLLSELAEKERISKNDAETLLCCCYGGGPAFLIGAVGGAVFSSVKIGVIMFASVFISNTIMLLFIGRISKIKTSIQKNAPELSADIFVHCIENAGSSILKMCAVILFFSGIMAVFEGIGAFDLAVKYLHLSYNGSVMLKSFFEVSNLSAANGRPYLLIPLMTAISGFGGVCVMLQIISVCGKRISLKKFFITRPLSFAMQYFVCYIINCIFKDEILAVSTNESKIIVDFNNFIPSICLIMMIFILLFRKRLAFLQKM